MEAHSTEVLASLRNKEVNERKEREKDKDARASSPTRARSKASAPGDKLQGGKNEADANGTVRQPLSTTKPVDTRAQRDVVGVGVSRDDARLPLVQNSALG